MSAPGAYVHVPFCAHRCAYCSFVAQAGREGEDAYFEAVGLEIRARAREARGPLDTVYFGGGTPSFVGPARIEGVVRLLGETFGLAPGAEVTAEGNPDDLDDARLEALRAAGVGRLSVGVQSLVDGELAWLERRHDAASARSAVSRAAALFPKVSADLMIGIPGQTRGTLLASLDGLLGAGVGHVSVYLLELEKAPRLVALRREEPGLFADDDEMAEMWELVDGRCEAAGLPRYEVSNWARPGEESRHNLKYWTGAPTLAFGVAAHSFDGRVRRANSGSTTEYARRVREGGTAFVSEEVVEGEAAVRERALLGLRLSAGIPERLLEEASASLAPSARARLRECGEAGLLERRDGRVRLTRRGVLLSNEVFSLLV